MSLKFLDPEIIQKLIEGHEDVLSPLARENEKYYASQACPRCGGSCKKLADHRTMFNGDAPLPKFYLECLACGEQFDPHTGMIIRIGNVAKAVEPTTPIINSEPE